MTVYCNFTGRLVMLIAALMMAQGVYAGDYPQARFVVLSDLHYFDPALGTSGAAFQDYLDHDRKLLAESDELLTIAFKEIATLPLDFVIISGDLTKDGEKQNHEIVAARLRQLEQTGLKVYVIPGNHDIMNGHAVRFSGDHTESIPTIVSTEFSNLYGDFGYREAIERDPHSLSYVVEPVPGLWLLALDSCKWRENKLDEDPIVGGKIYDETLVWIDSVLKKAAQASKTVIVTLHHGIIEHYPFNQKFYPEYLLDNYPIVAGKLAKAGVKLVFTGHFHAQDITSQSFDSPAQVIYDIETGSLVTAPCPYRIVELTQDQKAVINSRFITAVPSHPNDFKAFSEKYVFEGTKKLADEKLIGYWVSASDREKINPQAAKAYAVHLAGDEKKPAQLIQNEGVGLWGRFILFMQEDLIEGWYSDLPPQDNQVTIDLSN